MEARVKRRTLFRTNTSLIKARLELGLSQQELADRLGVALKTMWRWERGITVPYPYHRQRLCMLFQKTASELGFKSELA